MGRYITLSNNKITGIRYGSAIVSGEIESETGELGQIMQDNKFVDDIQLEQEMVLSPIELKLQALEDKLDSLIAGQTEIKAAQMEPKTMSIEAKL